MHFVEVADSLEYWEHQILVWIASRQHKITSFADTFAEGHAKRDRIRQERMALQFQDVEKTKSPT